MPSDLPSNTPLVWENLGSDIVGLHNDAFFGNSVSLSENGRHVAVGSFKHNGNGMDSGLVKVFKFSNSKQKWVRHGNDIQGEKAGDQSGISVSLSSSGNVIAIGANKNDGSNGMISTGHTRVYQYIKTNKQWNQLGSDIDGESSNDSSGFSVSISRNGKMVAIGAMFNQDSGENSGHVRVFEYGSITSTEWTQVGSDIDGEALGDQSGHSVFLSASGERVVIGAIENSGADGFNNIGHVRVYEYTTSEDGFEWVKLGSDIDGEAPNDHSGWSVSMSGDGSRVAIGACKNDGKGSNSGHVRVYTYDESSYQWKQMGSDIDGEAKGDQFGYSLSMSEDGNTIAVGAKFNDTSGKNSGQVKAFEYNSVNTEWDQLGSTIYGNTKGDQSGWSVSLSGDGRIVAVGSPNHGVKNRKNRGKVRVFELRRFVPSDVPSTLPSDGPSQSILPSMSPSEVPSAVRSSMPSEGPSNVLSSTPSTDPSRAPSGSPSNLPSSGPSRSPSDVPSRAPSGLPSLLPSDLPSVVPSNVPSLNPSKLPSMSPSFAPILVDYPPGWYDSDGTTYDCNWYSQDNNCLVYGNSYRNFGFTANEACIVCGGGVYIPYIPLPDDILDDLLGLIGGR